MSCPPHRPEMRSAAEYLRTPGVASGLVAAAARAPRMPGIARVRAWTCAKLPSYHRALPIRRRVSGVALSGSICALATPFRAGDGALDLDAYGQLVDQQLAGGTRALVVAGSTGEAAALDDEEYSRLIAFA